MKHTLKITYLLVGFFLLSQVIGLTVVNQYIDHKVLEETGKVTFVGLAGGAVERPEATGAELIVILVIAILAGTGLLLLLARFKRINIWKVWYTFSVAVTLFFAFERFITLWPALALGIGLAVYKVFKPQIVVHNITELFMYGGLAAIFVPIGGFTIGWALLLLFLISLYDMYAVWKSKHMVKLAQFTTESKVFAGLSIPYNKKSGKLEKASTGKLGKGEGTVRNAILGGGDIGFPLLFAGVVMKDLMVNYSVWLGFLLSLVIPLFTAVALLWLFLRGQKDRFYPAMPFLSAGCLAGFIVLNIITYFTAGLLLVPL